MSATIHSGKLPYRISANNMHVTLEGRLSSDLAAELGGLVATQPATGRRAAPRRGPRCRRTTEKRAAAQFRLSQPHSLQRTARL